MPNVAEVASVGGMVRQYQVVLDPDKLRAYNIPHGKVIEAVQKANQETGGSVLELGEAEYMVRASGYLQSLDDFRKIPLTTTDAGVSVRLGDVARIQIGPEMRRGIAELERRGRSGRRRHRDALGQERAGDHRRGEGEARDAASRACRRAWRSCRPTTARA